MTPDAARACLDSCVAKADEGTCDGVRSVIFTGGEPFYAPALLEGALAHASSLGLLSVVITNAYWASNEAVALRTLRRFAGIRLLTISTDVYHRAFVSAAKVRAAISAAAQLSIPCTVAVCADEEAELEETIREIRGVIAPDRIRAVGTLPAGRAAGRQGRACSTASASLDGVCTGADIPIVFPDGRVVACMGIVDGLPPGHPLLLGTVANTPLGDLLEAGANDMFVHAMRALGPGAIVRALGRNGSDLFARGRKAYGRCSLCYAMAADADLLERVLGVVSRREFAERTAAARRRVLGEDTAGVGRSRRQRKGGRRS